ncbi:MAG: DMT family transporter [Candidatus Woesearchaeota archaeon]|jgi:drug/metabolite transporter (DMT)-like permease
MTFELGIFFAFGAMIFWGLGDFLIQRTARKIGALETLLWIGIVGSLGLFPFVINDLHLLLDASNLFLILGLGVLGFVGSLMSFKAFEQGKISVVDMILVIELPIIMVLSFIFLKEVPSFVQILLILFSLIGIILLIATESFGNFRTKLEKGVLLAIIAALFLGGYTFLTGFSSKNITPMLALWGPWFLCTIIGVFFMVFRKKKSVFFRDAMKIKWLLISTCIVDILAWVFYVFAVKNNEVSIITAITESYPVIALGLGVWINRERILFHQWLGAGLALACSILLSLTL